MHRFNMSSETLGEVLCELPRTLNVATHFQASVKTDRFTTGISYVLLTITEQHTSASIRNSREFVDIMELSEWNFASYK